MIISNEKKFRFFFSSQLLISFLQVFLVYFNLSQITSSSLLSSSERNFYVNYKLEEVDEMD